MRSASSWPIALPVLPFVQAVFVPVAPGLAWM
jgi:hypothetical protein